VERVLQCECGFEARAENEACLVAKVQEHAWEAHGMELSPDQALLLTFRAELDAAAASQETAAEPGHDPRQTTSTEEER
jgi:Protein of unknown function (DUF1059)